MKSFSRPLLMIGLAVFIVISIENQGFLKQAFAETAASPYASARDGLKDKINHKINKKWFSCRDEMICGISAIPYFYEKRDYRPAWTDDDMQFYLADDLVKAIGNSDQHGLQPEDYHLSKIRELINLVRTDNLQTRLDPLIYVDLDILLTDGFLLYASHLTSGRVNPENIHSDWEAFSPKADLTKMLESAIETNSMAETLSNLGPNHPSYLKLKQALAQYREMEKNIEWPRIPNGPTLRLWDFGERVATLNKRLSFEEEGAFDENNTQFDETLEKKVKVFQNRHGLDPDGIVGAKTLAALNVSLSRRVRQIELNLERWRWIPRDLGKKYVIVNIADFKLYVMEGLSSVMDMRVVVGKAYRKTPVFSDKIKFLVLNPYWNVPTTIAVKDLVPDICKDINTIYKKDITVFENWSTNAAVVDPKTIDWCKISRTHFRYKLRQNPGPKNSLGRIKFIFPNQYAVYLHDTPQRNLFQLASRGFSSGCIRLEKPIELALYLLKDDPDWSPEKFMAQLETNEHKVIGLKNYMPVHLLYWTAWADENGDVQFREDIYERDTDLDSALRKRGSREYGNF